MNKSVIVVLILSLLIVILLVAYKISTEIHEYKEAEEEYQQLKDNYISDLIEEKDKNNVAKKNESDEKDILSINWNELEKINPDIIGWIIITDSQVNYPIVKSKDNDDYLHKTFEGKKNSSGAIFLDCRNVPDFKNDNTIVYGHNMKNGSMFKTLNYYAKEKYFQKSGEIWIFTRKWKKQYQIISAHETVATGETYRLSFSDMKEYKKHLEKEKEKSLYETGVPINEQKPIITLSTCRGKEGNRFVLILQEKEK